MATEAAAQQADRVPALLARAQLARRLAEASEQREQQEQRGQQEQRFYDPPRI